MSVCAKCGETNLIGGILIIPYRLCSRCKKDWYNQGKPDILDFIQSKQVNGHLNVYGPILVED